MFWVASLGPRVQPKTTKAYLTHLRSLHVDPDLPFHSTEAPVVQRLIRGIKRYHRERDRKPKLPVTLDVLTCIRAQLNVTARPGDRVMYASCCLAFAALLRCGEFTVNGATFNAGLHLTSTLPLTSCSPCRPRRPSPSGKWRPVLSPVRLRPCGAWFYLSPPSVTPPCSACPAAARSRGSTSSARSGLTWPLPASMCVHTLATASAAEAPPLLLLQVSASMKYSSSAAGAATHISCTLMSPSPDPFNSPPEFLGSSHPRTIQNFRFFGT